MVICFRRHIAVDVCHCCGMEELKLSMWSEEELVTSFDAQDSLKVRGEIVQCNA